MTRALLPLIAAVAMFVPASGVAQLPAPKMPVTLPVEVVDLKSVKYEGDKARYARAGTMPIEYRLSRNPTFDDASWRSFAEGTTTKFAEFGKSWISGTVPIPTTHQPSESAGCPANTIRWRVFLQFRIRNAARQLINSQVRGDSACVPMGG